MNLLKRSTLVIGLLGIGGAAHAEITSTWTLTNDYDFRGITQTAQDPALQASVDYAHDSGFYLGAWGSNVDFGDAADVDLEIDLYAGFTKELESGVTWDVGLIQYAFPDESDFNFLEIYGSVAKDWFKGKLWYSPDFGGDSTSGDTPAWYVDTSGTFPLPNDFSLLAHIGYSGGDYWDDADSEYFDYSVGVGYSVSNFNLALKWVDGSDLEAADGTPDDVFSSESRIVFSVATTFPWGADAE
jgi:uncharacterized protein (TIGR02001 family)